MFSCVKTKTKSHFTVKIVERSIRSNKAGLFDSIFSGWDQFHSTLYFRKNYPRSVELSYTIVEQPIWRKYLILTTWYLSNDLRNFNKIFRKNVFCNIINTLTLFEKTAGGRGKLTTSLTFLGLITLVSRTEIDFMIMINIVLE